jgi:hypothetical protein
MSDFEVWCRYHINDTNPESLLVAEQVWDILQAEIERLRESLIRTDNENCRVSQLRVESVQREQQKNREIKRLKKASKWISVDERLPEHSSDVLFFSAEIGSVEAGFFDGAYFGDAVSEPVMDVTHWQPLPEPPKVQKEEEISND